MSWIRFRQIANNTHRDIPRLTLRVAVAVLSAMIVFTAACTGSESEQDQMSDATSDGTAQLLPGSEELAGFTRTGKISTNGRGDLWQFAGPATSEYLYNGFVTMSVASYVSADQSKKLDYHIYQFNTGKQAFALYTFFRSPDKKFFDLGAEGYISGDTLIVLKSIFHIRVVGAYDNAESDLIQAAKVTLARIEEGEALPQELLLFPSEGRIVRSEKLTLQDFWGNVDLTDVFSSDYVINGDSLTLHFRTGSDNYVVNAVRQFIGEGGSITEFNVDRGFQAFSGTHREYGSVYCTVREGLLAVAIGYDEKQTALTLVDRLMAKVTETDEGDN